MTEWGRGSRYGSATQIFAGAHEGDMQETSFVAGPTGAVGTVVELQVGQIGTCVRAPFVTGLAPERDPLAGMRVTDSLECTQHYKSQRPNRHECEMAPSIQH